MTTCDHDWMANLGILDFDDHEPVPFACRQCGMGGYLSDDDKIVPTGAIAVRWVRPEPAPEPEADP